MTRALALSGEGQYAGGLSAAGGGAEEKPFDAIGLVRRSLRGRWAFALSLAVVVGAGLGALGWLTGEKRYSSEAQVRVVANPSRLVYDDTPMTQQLSLFELEAMVSTQAALIQQERTLLAVLEDERIAQTRAEGREIDLATLKENLETTFTRQSKELIVVRYTDKSATVARRVVQAVVEAYQTLYVRGNDSAQAQISELATLENQYRTRRSSLQDQIQALTSDWGGTSNLSLVEADVRGQIRLKEFERERAASTIEQLQARAAKGLERAPDVGTGDVAEIVTFYSGLDAEVGRLGQQWSAAVTRRDGLLAAGQSADHPGVRRVSGTIQGFEQQIRARAGDVAARYGDTIDAVILGPDAMAQIKTAESDVERLDTELEELRARADAIVRSASKVNDLSKELQTVEAELQKIGLSRTAITTESSNSTSDNGRIVVLSNGTFPTEPSDDTRKRNAAAGLVVGGGLVMGLFLLVGVLDRRIRYASEVEEAEPGVGLMGVLPMLPRGENGKLTQETAADVANAMHAARTTLQLSVPSSGSLSVLVTSGGPGEGKTTVATALAISFASTGERTVLVDMDLVAPSVGGEFGVVGGVGVEPWLTDTGEVGEVQASAIEGLSLLLPRPEDASLVATLGPRAVRRMVERLRADFDVIVFDSGPLAGSIESALVASAVDATVLVVGRGAPRDAIKKTLDQLEVCRGRLAGTLFNMALASDFARAVSGRSVGRGTSARPWVRQHTEGMAKQLSPVAAQVLAHSPVAIGPRVVDEPRSEVA